MYHRKYLILFILTFVVSFVALVVGILLKFNSWFGEWADIMIALSSGVISGAVITLLSQYKARAIFILKKLAEEYQNIINEISTVSREDIFGQANLKARDKVKIFADDLGEEWSLFCVKIMDLTETMRRTYSIKSRLNMKENNFYCPDYLEIELFENHARKSKSLAEKEDVITKCMSYINDLQAIKRFASDKLNNINTELNYLYKSKF